MTAFAIGAALCAVAALLFIALPWVRANQASTPGTRALPLLVALPAVMLALGLYLHLSTWAWNGPADAGLPQELVNLKRATDERPNDLQAWLRLGQLYVQMEQYPVARTVFERANRIAGGSSADALSGLAEAMALGGEAGDTPRVRELFERALQLDPHSAKALFYSAMIAMRSNELPLARARFATMLTLEVPPEIHDALQKQIDSIDAQLKPAAADASTAVSVKVSVSPALAARYADSAARGATLFVFVRGPEGGAPLAVKRLASTLPQTVMLSSADAMMANHAIQPHARVTVAARLSASGSPLPQAGDLSGEIAYVAGKDGQRELVISQIAP